MGTGTRVTGESLRAPSPRSREVQVPKVQELSSTDQNVAVHFLQQRNLHDRTRQKNAQPRTHTREWAHERISTGVDT